MPCTSVYIINLLPVIHINTQPDKSQSGRKVQGAEWCEINITTCRHYANVLSPITPNKETVFIYINVMWGMLRHWRQGNLHTLQY